MLALILAGITVLALNVYVLFAGADFGGGVWDLLATGRRREEQRTLVAHAIGPIWEANHVWLILVVVLLFTCFPPVFSLLGITLHIPLTLVLIGIVLRGSAFAFRSALTARSEHGEPDPVYRRWGRVFAVASLVTPLLLGIAFGAVASEGVGETPAARCLALTDAPARYAACTRAAAAPASPFHATFLAPWLDGFSLSVGVLTVVLFALLAAVFLTVEAEGEGEGRAELQEDFRVRALAAAVAAFVAAFASLLLAPPRLRAGLTASTWALPLHAATALAALVVIGALWRRRYRLARAAVIVQVSLIFWGWAVSQFPYMLPPALTIQQAAASPATLRPVLWALAAGALVLLPSLWFLLRVFKGRWMPSGR